MQNTDESYATPAERLAEDLAVAEAAVERAWEAIRDAQRSGAVSAPLMTEALQMSRATYFRRLADVDALDPQPIQ